MSPRLQRIATWLCAIGALWLGVVPAQGLVMCLEPGGGVSLSVSVDGHCAGCSDGCDAATTSTPAHGPDCCGVERDAPAADRGVGTAPLAAGTCPCIDIALSRDGDDGMQPGTIHPLLDDVVVGRRSVTDAPKPQSPFHCAPAWVTASSRPPPALALRRSVVLLI